MDKKVTGKGNDKRNQWGRASERKIRERNREQKC